MTGVSIIFCEAVMIFAITAMSGGADKRKNTALVQSVSTMVSNGKRGMKADMVQKALWARSLTLAPAKQGGEKSS